MVKSVSRFLSTRKFTMKSKFFHSLSNSLAIHIDLPQKSDSNVTQNRPIPNYFPEGNGPV